MKAIRLWLLPLLVCCLTTIWAQTAAAFPPYIIDLYRPYEMVQKGISATIQETESGSLDCTLRFSNEKLGKRIYSVELYSSTENAMVDLEMQTYNIDDSLVCRFKLSRDLLMHGQVTIGFDKDAKLETFYRVAFVDMIDFGGELPPGLKRRQARLLEMEIQKKLPRYEDTTPARGEAADPREVFQDKTAIIPYKPPIK